MNTFASYTRIGPGRHARARPAFRKWVLRRRRPIGALLSGAVLALQLAIVWHDADHLWHDTHHDSAICAVAAASPIGGVAECTRVAAPSWSVVCLLAPPAVQRGGAVLLLSYQSRAPPQSIG